MRKNILACTGLLALTSLAGCDAISKALEEGGICLDDLLEMADLTREDLEASDADELVESAMVAQEEVLGVSIVKDCRAEEGMDSLVADSSGGGGEESPREGESVSVGSAGQLGGTIVDMVDSAASDGMEVAILLDTTCSMRDDEAAVDAALEEIIQSVQDNNGLISLASYGDNQGCDDPWYARNDGDLIDPSANTMVADSLLTGIVRTGGCDWPESLYDGIYKTADELPWASANRRIIAITDATALEPPRTNHSQEDVTALLESKSISLDTILVGVSY
ncbi:MAG: hypothetical protein CL930_07830 [Deltaproteobacteria bacterium]|nr:hypothetical protein [Deltaproteobacteria bacterium]|tara:strand:+ start:469 stop:1305 length:837 start_codon:yes stop_codon:yes gene_type:complete